MPKNWERPRQHTIGLRYGNRNEFTRLYPYYAVFGGFLSALRRAKLKPRYKQEFDASDRERLLNELRHLHPKLGRTLFDEDVDKARRRKEVSLPYHFVRAFGSVPAAIETAGASKKNYSHEELIAILKRSIVRYRPRICSGCTTKGKLRR